MYNLSTNINDLGTMRKMFIENISHEIRSPLNTIVGYTHLLQNLTLDSQQRKYVNIISKANSQLLHIINDILDLSMLSSGNISLNESDVDLREIIRECLELLNPYILEKEIKMSIDFGDFNTSLVLDVSRFMQVIMNLTKNSINLSSRCSNFFIKLWKESDLLLVSLSVSGKQDMLLNPFSKLTNFGDLNENTIGLILAHYIVGLMGGHISHESDTVTFSLKLRHFNPYINTLVLLTAIKDTYRQACIDSLKGIGIKTMYLDEVDLVYKLNDISADIIVSGIPDHMILNIIKEIKPSIKVKVLENIPDSFNEWMTFFAN